MADERPGTRRSNPVTRAAFRRQVRAQIYAPLGLGMLALALAAFFVASQGIASARTWADTAVVFLLLPAMALGLLVLAGISALAVGIGWLMARIPGPFHKVHRAAMRVGAGARRLEQAAAMTIVVPRAAAAAVWAVARRLGSRRGAD